jgi:hypothetical protein
MNTDILKPYDQYNFGPLSKQSQIFEKVMKPRESIEKRMTRNKGKVM